MTTVNHTATPRLFMIRHGETAWSLSGQHTGLTDIPLTPTGEARAKLLGSRLSGETFARVFTSPLIRAKRTCELAGYADRMEVDPDLVEWNYGAYDGLTGAEIRRTNPDWNVFRDGAPGGESPSQAAARADKVLSGITGIEGDIAMFSSGHFIRLLAARWLGLEPKDATHFYTATASVSILGYEHGRDDRVILLWNDTRP